MSASTLHRETFELSRTMEFFSERELIAQIGHRPALWPVALLKELLDNALDACENAGIAPAITVELQDDALIVTDNGPGLPLAVMERSLDYAVRVSDKTGYVSPSRGQQGNALKTLWAAPFVATGTGRIEVETAAYRRVVQVTADRIAQVTQVDLIDTEPSDVKTGTKIVLHWRRVAATCWMANPPIFTAWLLRFSTLTRTAPWRSSRPARARLSGRPFPIGSTGGLITPPPRTGTPWSDSATWWRCC